MGRTEYTKTEQEKFRKIPDAVWKGLHQKPKSITTLEKNRDRKYLGDLVQKRFHIMPVWQNKQDLDVFVGKELDLDISQYGKRSENTVYKRIANVIIDLRKSGKIIDWRYGAPRYGIWRLANTVESRAIVNFKNRDYSSSLTRTLVARRTKQTQFRNELLYSFRHCLFCEFRMDTYLRAAHIVPFSEMQKHEPKNALNPVNGLLLCTLCDIAFERGDITVDEDYQISQTKGLKTLNKPNTANHCWLSNVKKKLQIKESSKIEPDARYLKWKLRLNNT